MHPPPSPFSFHPHTKKHKSLPLSLPHSRHTSTPMSSYSYIYMFKLHHNCCTQRVKLVEDIELTIFSQSELTKLNISLNKVGQIASSFQCRIIALVHRPSPSEKNYYRSRILQYHYDGSESQVVAENNRAFSSHNFLLFFLNLYKLDNLMGYTCLVELQGEVSQWTSNVKRVN